MQSKDQMIRRYLCILTDYMTISKQLEKCTSEDKEFYQSICLVFAEKMKDVERELAEQGGFVLCRRDGKSFN